MSDAFDRFDDMAERTIYPWIDDESHERDDYNDFTDTVDDEEWDDSFDDSMDGDHDSAMRDAGFGSDEDYGYFGGEDY
jgi:hypothetical protein